MLKPKNPIASAEADLAQLGKRRAGLDARRTSAAAAALTATSARRALLVDSDEPDAGALTAADRACRETADAAGAAADALAEVDNRIAALEGRLAGLREAADRERRAVAIEASAKAADVAIERIRRAAGEMDSARRDLVAALTSDAVTCYAPPADNAVEWDPRYLTTALHYDFRGEPTFDTLNVEQVAARIAGHLVTGAGVLPGLGVARLEDVVKMHAGGGSTHVLAPLNGETVRSVLTDGLRAAASRIREGLSEAPIPGTRELRRRADRWTTDTDGRSFDSAGVPVTNGGFYVDDAA